MDRKKLISAILCVMLVTSLFSGCQAAPDTAVVAGKNDGVFESALNSSAEPVEGANTEAFSYTDKFTSTDGKIEFNIDVSDIKYSGNPMPVIQVTPEEITPELAKRVAETLYGEDTTFYEYSEVGTKSEIENEIVRWTLFSSYDYIYDEYKDSPLSPEEIEEAIQIEMEANKRILEEYKELYETASETEEQEECLWTFFPSSHYEPFSDENKTKKIRALLEINGVSINYNVSNRMEDDYRIQMIMSFIHSPDYTTDTMREAFANSGWFVQEKPDAETVENIRIQAEEMIEKMDIGEWVITGCEASYSGYYGGYVIYVGVAPVYDGVMVTPQTQLSNLKSEEEYASNYYYETLGFTMAADGTVIDFSYMGPLEVVEVINASTAVMPFDELMERVKTQMSMDDIGMYQMFNPGDVPESQVTDRVEVDITSMEFGLSRTKIRDNPDDFYLVPSVTLRGDYTLYNSSGDMIETGMEGVEQTLLVLNLVDGSVIHYDQQ